MAETYGIPKTVLVLRRGHERMELRTKGCPTMYSVWDDPAVVYYLVEGWDIAGHYDTE